MKTLQGIALLIVIISIIVLIIKWITLPFTLNSIDKKLDELIKIMKER
ncbi:hypothetical protein HYH70_15710 [Clostridium botulinum]|nr:hypothetical protein [Clostridium botulinum]MBY6907030.1 hypothetical protein [Clostridium botulinum]MBY6928544.1 hypothetical protein [Clostridium botulinum]MBY6956139.1 hypothetical protein [Clostridium botulinum]